MVAYIPDTKDVGVLRFSNQEYMKVDGQDEKQAKQSFLNFLKTLTEDDILVVSEVEATIINMKSQVKTNN